MPLTDTKIRALKPKDKPYKVSDEKGLYLQVNARSKLWRMAYRHQGKQKLLSFGPYPEVTLAMARDRRDDARKMIRDGVDPGAKRKAEKNAISNTFQAVALEWLEQHKKRLSESTQRMYLSMLENYVFPYIGDSDVGQIKPAEVLCLLRRIEKKGIHQTAHRVMNIISQVLRFAVATLRAEQDPTIALRGALTPYRGGHHPAILDIKALGDFLVSAMRYRGFGNVKASLLLQVLLFVRPGELRKAEWSEIDFDKALWVIPAEKMKMRVTHIVPLAKQSLIIFKHLRSLNGECHYVFPGARTKDRPMSEMAVTAALRAMGYEKEQVTAHGFRATARTLLDEELRYRPEVIEMQLAHAVRDPLGRAYNRTQYLEERKVMMQAWADYLTRICGHELEI